MLEIAFIYQLQICQELNDPYEVRTFIIELKKKHDNGAKSPEKWLPFIVERLKTDTGRKLAQSIIDSNWDDWWFKNYSE